MQLKTWQKPERSGQAGTWTKEEDDLCNAEEWAEVVSVSVLWFRTLVFGDVEGVHTCFRSCG